MRSTVAKLEATVDNIQDRMSNMSGRLQRCEGHIEALTKHAQKTAHLGQQVAKLESRSIHWDAFISNGGSKPAKGHVAPEQTMVDVQNRLAGLEEQLFESVQHMAQISERVTGSPRTPAVREDSRISAEPLAFAPPLSSHMQILPGLEDDSIYKPFSWNASNAAPTFGSNQMAPLGPKVGEPILSNMTDLDLGPKDDAILANTYLPPADIKETPRSTESAKALQAVPPSPRGHAGSGEFPDHLAHIAMPQQELPGDLPLEPSPEAPAINPADVKPSAPSSSPTTLATPSPSNSPDKENQQQSESAAAAQMPASKSSWSMVPKFFQRGKHIS